jgi:hypothetical protein
MKSLRVMIMLCVAPRCLAQPSAANWKITGHYRYFGP